MGWQKTFTLARRAKGCHLVTEEVVANIQHGLEGVKVPFFAFVYHALYQSSRVRIL